MGPTPLPSRRDVAKAVVALAAAAPAATAQEKPPEKVKPAEPPANIPDAMLEVVRVRYSEHLSPEQLTAIKRGLSRHQFLAERLKHFKLKNADEPAFVFSAHVS
jgi:hypothetical protein